MSTLLLSSAEEGILGTVSGEKVLGKDVYLSYTHKFQAVIGDTESAVGSIVLPKHSIINVRMVAMCSTADGGSQGAKNAEMLAWRNSGGAENTAASPTYDQFTDGTLTISLGVDGNSVVVLGRYENVSDLTATFWATLTYELRLL